MSQNSTIISELYFTNRNLVEYVYAVDGRKLREKHIMAVDGLTVQMGNTLELTPAQTMAVDSMDYAGNLRFTRQRISSSNVFFNLDYHFDGGYLSVTPPNSTSQLCYNLTTHFFIRDHQGRSALCDASRLKNNRLVVDGSDTIKQINHYYPYGGPWNYFSTNQGFQPYKYNGKELDRVHGLDWYDYGARRYDPAFCMFTQMDPLCEDTPHINPYVYCAGNPVNYVDPDGKHIRVKKRDGMFIIDGGEVDDDLNIYDVSNGWDNRVSIGEALTQYSFFNDEGNPVKGSIISLSDNSGNEFLTDFVNNTPSILTYIFNATEGKKYDFKRQNAPDPSLISPDLYNNRRYESVHKWEQLRCLS